MSNDNLLLEVKGLKKHFFLNKDMLGRPRMTLRAVDNVSFKLEAGKTIGVVGESGCGKTTLGRTILQLYDTTAGKSLYYGHSLDEFAPKYYIDDLDNAVKLKNQLMNRFNRLSTFNSALKLELFNKFFKLNYDLTIEEYDKAAVEINKLMDENDKETSKNVSVAGKLLAEVYSLLERLANLCGAYALAEDENLLEAKSLLIERSRLISKANQAKEAINENELEEINRKLLEIKASIPDSKLKKSMDDNREFGLDLKRLTVKEMRSLRTEIQLIFQDPYSSLPPRMTVGSIISEAVKVHKIVPKEELNEYVHKIMKKCGLQPQYFTRYPHEFSGGQRQRICIARALAVNPRLVICDEPVSALDVSIQAQIINLLKELQRELGLTYIFISHDLSVVKYITDNILVMYLGNMMEIGDTDDIFKHPLHPYTQALFSAVPNPDPESKMERIRLEGDIPSPANPPKGCKFHTRCKKCMAVCKLHQPTPIEFENNHFVACHLYNEEVMANLDKYEAELKEFEREEALKAEALENESKMQKLINKIKK